MSTHTPIPDHVNAIDADQQIQLCMKLDNLNSFFLFAGAGSGKTRSLVNALLKFNEDFGRQMRFTGRKVCVITYTNAACDEIKQRIEFNELFEISTIHSFLWTIISNFHSDIKVWIINNLKAEIAELQDLQRKGRAGSKASIDRDASIEAKNRRLLDLEKIQKFTYSPTGENSGKDSLNHSEVIKIGSDFIMSKPLMQSFLISKYPVILIDESQDTNKHLMEAILSLELKHKGNVSLGLFGDTMQRIYADGKFDLGQNLPIHWAKPEKKINHRCPKRVVELINKIRSVVDTHAQLPADKSADGFVRIFILPTDTLDKEKKEAEIELKMAEITGDDKWKNSALTKKLILEHHMAARRLGFIQMFQPLYKVDKLRTGLLDGSLSGLRLFSNLILPLLKARQLKDEFSIAKILRTNSPLLKRDILKSQSDQQPEQIKKIQEAVNAIFEIWNNSDPTFFDVLQCVIRHRLFEIPNSFKTLFARKAQEAGAVSLTVREEGEEEEVTGVEDLSAWEEFLMTPFNQIEQYSDYVSEKSPFDTHQGIKGREFERVMVIIDDSETNGFLFKYDKLFGVDPITDQDRKNIQEGNDTSFARVRRLFYVTCSRAEESLAIIAYTKNPEQVKNFVIQVQWFKEDEVII